MRVLSLLTLAVIHSRLYRSHTRFFPCSQFSAKATYSSRTCLFAACYCDYHSFCSAGQLSVRPINYYFKCLKLSHSLKTGMYALGCCIYVLDLERMTVNLAPATVRCMSFASCLGVTNADATYCSAKVYYTFSRKIAFLTGILSHVAFAKHTRLFLCCNKAKRMPTLTHVRLLPERRTRDGCFFVAFDATRVWSL